MSLVGQLGALVGRLGVEFKSVRTAIAARALTYDATGALPVPVEWQGVATTDASGKFSVTFPAGLFSKPPLVFATAVSTGADAASTNIATPWPSTATGCSGHVATGNVLSTVLISVGANGLKLVGAGVAVNVLARSVR